MIIYVGGLMISLLLFNYQYAREHGFVEWLAFGEIVPSLKATIWPYYVVRGVSGSALPDGRLAETREGFRSVDIPRYYPVLLEHIREHGPLSVNWVSQTGDVQGLRVWLGATGSVFVRTTVPTSERPDGSGPLRELIITMNDQDADGTVDRIEYRHADGTTEAPDPAGDTADQVFWDQCLAITFAYGEPFK
jgi:hypothetical protein